MIATRRRIEAATGYLALGMRTEASDELDAIAAEDRLLPSVLSVRSNLYMEAKQWDLLLAVSRELARQVATIDPGWIGWAYALRELNRVEEAKAVLLEAERIHGKRTATLHYNLACYYCLLGDHVEARRRLRIACKMEKQYQKAALDDEDLKAMRDEIAAMK